MSSFDFISGDKISSGGEINALILPAITARPNAIFRYNNPGRSKRLNTQIIRREDSGNETDCRAND